MRIIRDNMLRAAIIISGALIPAVSRATPQCDGAQAVGATCAQDALSGPLDNIINTVFYIAGAIAVILILIGGINYITSEGDSQKTANARNTIINAVVGLIIIIMARAIVAFVASRI